MHYLYKIINTINNKLYIGQTTRPQKRWYDHRYASSSPTKVIHFAIAKYGAHNFIFEIIATTKTQDDADYLEKLLIEQYQSHVENCGYNIARGGRSSTGYHHSDETKAKISAANKGKQRSEETKQLIAENTRKQLESGNHPRLGKKHSEESRQKMIESSKGQVAWNKGLEGCFSDETKQKMREAKLGKQASEETKQKMSASRTKNRKCSIEGCENSHDAKGYCSKHYYHFVDKQNRPWSSRKRTRSRTTNKI